MYIHIKAKKKKCITTTVFISLTCPVTTIDIYNFLFLTFQHTLCPQPALQLVIVIYLVRREEVTQITPEEFVPLAVFLCALAIVSYLHLSVALGVLGNITGSSHRHP